MDLNLTDQIAVIAGGAQGIGYAIAEEFAGEGAHVVIIDRDERVTEIADGLRRRANVQVDAIAADVTDLTRLQQIAAELQSAGRCPRHVVFAVGIGSGKFGFPFWNLAPSDWSRILEVNVVGAVNVAHAFVPLLVDAKAGTMLFLSSVAGQMGSQTDPPYSASKAALINFAQCAAKDLAPHGVRVNTICPGMVQTSLNRSVWQAWRRQQPPELQRSYEDWAGEKIKNVVPLGRWQEPADVAAMAVFLASERANNVAGQTINVDGGFVMHW